MALDTPLRRLFDYLPSRADETMPAPGSRVRVPFGTRSRIGIVVEHAPGSDLPAGKLKAIDESLDAAPIVAPSELELLTWAAEYYHHPLGEVLFAALPRLLRDGAPARALVWIWRATESGRLALDSSDLKRARRQREVLGAIVAAGSIAQPVMSAVCGSNWQGIVRTLERRGWVEAIAAPTTEPSRDDGSAGDRDSDGDSMASRTSQPAYVLSPDQRTAVDCVVASLGVFGAHLLHGITGSGKTEVYLQVAQRALERGKRALVLVPEIGLTPQLIARFEARFHVPIVALHSALTDSERLAAWRAAYDGSARIVLGTRSAVFAPVRDLGVIVVDEEHDASFKQHEGGFRYSARDLAIVRAQRAGVPVVLGSATPSLETLHNAHAGRYVRLALPQRAGHARPPKLVLVDLRSESLRHGLSTFVVEAMRRHLDDGGQVLVYINRRGYAPTLACQACGWIAGCDACDARLTMHRHDARLRCHHCGADEALPARCPQCGYAVKPVGQGTERVEETLAQLFPDAPLARLDRDTARDNEALEAVVQRVATGEARILVGTQMITKGHHFPDVTLAVVLNADHGLFSIDFRAAERLAQTIVQVAGRAGRGDKPGEVLIQTEYPGHPLLTSLLNGGYEGFARTALEERAAAAWPPYSRLAAVRASALTLVDATRFLNEARAALRPPASVRLRGPAPAARTKRADRFHAHLLVESEDRAALHRFLTQWVPLVEALPSARRVRWALDVDPLELL